MYVWGVVVLWTVVLLSEESFLMHDVGGIRPDEVDTRGLPCVRRFFRVP